MKDGAGEGGAEPQGHAVGQAQPQGLVLGHEEQPGVGVDAALLQSPCCPQQPLLLLLPPQCMVRPVPLDLCREGSRKPAGVRHKMAVPLVMSEEILHSETEVQSLESLQSLHLCRAAAGSMLY